MRPKDTAYIIERLAVRFMAMVADHERQLAEHRAAFGARTEADAKIIAGLQEKVYLSEGECNVLRPLVVDAAKYKAERDDLYQREGIEKKRRMDVESERDGLQTQVQDMRAEMERLQMEVAALKSQTPKHPAKVGEWVRKTTDGLMYKTGEARRLVSYEIIKGEIWCNLEDGASWKMSVCEPCDPPTEATHDTPEGRSVVESVIRNDRNTEPRPGDTVRLVRIPSRSDVSPKLQTTLEWPWIERWGTLNQTALVVEPAYQLAGAVSVCLSANVHARWPICCVEVVRTEPDDIKVGDLVEVFQSSSTWTFTDDVGKSGTITRIETDPVSRTEIVHLREHPDDAFALCDVRKVTT